MSVREITVDTFKDKIFLKKSAMIALPVAMQGLLNSTINLVDNLMIGSLGETNIAAVGLANKVFVVFSLLVFGVCSGSAVLASQFWGNNDWKGVRKTLGLALIIVLLGCLFFVIPGVTNPELVMSIFTPSKDTISAGTKYLKIAVFTYPLIGISNSFAAILRSANRVKAPVIVSVFTIIINVCLNYILIFGAFGAPELGVAGAAIATLVARTFEVITLITIVYVGKSPVAVKGKDILGIDMVFFKLFFKTCLPIIINEFMWGLGTTIYSLAYGRMGDQAVASITIATTITDMLIVFFQGTSNASAIILGNELGANRLNVAEDYGKKFICLQFVLSIIVGILLVSLRWKFISLFQVTPEVARNISLCCIVFALYMPMKMYNYINIVGILRSGGDSNYCLFLDCFGVWVIGIPCAFLGGLVLKLPIYLVFAMVLSEEIFKAIFGFIRYRKKKWLRNLVV